MTNKIDQKIVGFEVVKALKDAVETINTESDVVVEHMHEAVERPDVLPSTTYKISTGIGPALYITISDIVLNKGTPHEVRRPFEIFVNSKDMTAFQWIVALTRMLSAVFRKGGDVTFLVDEFASVFDPNGGYYIPGGGGKRVNSVVHHIGMVIEQHLQWLGMLEKPKVTKEATEEELRNALICPSCQNKSLVVQEGCATCLNCGHSKCG